MYVLDSSALLAVLNVERGHDVVRPILTSSSISSVNLAEVLTKLTEKNIRADDALDGLTQLGVEVVEYDIDQAVKTAQLRTLTKHLGLSLGDRACLSLATLRKSTAVTADKAWASLKFCKVRVIR